MSLFLVAFDSTSTDSILAHEAVTSLPNADWWHYLAGLYLIAASGPLPHIRQELLRRWPGGPVLIMPVRKSPDGYLPDGQLPHDAWTWINGHIR